MILFFSCFLSKLLTLHSFLKCIHLIFFSFHHLVYYCLKYCTGKYVHCSIFFNIEFHCKLTLISMYDDNIESGNGVGVMHKLWGTRWSWMTDWGIQRHCWHVLVVAILATHSSGGFHGATFSRWPSWASACCCVWQVVVFTFSGGTASTKPSSRRNKANSYLTMLERNAGVKSKLVHSR